MRFVECAVALLMMSAAASSIASAQNAPSLRSSLDLVRTRIAHQGQMTYSATVHDSATNQTWTSSFSVEATNVTMDEANCEISYHWHTTVNGKVYADSDSTLQFRGATDIVLVSMSEDMTQSALQQGHGTWGLSVSPQIWVIHLNRASDGALSAIDFRDKTVAQNMLATIKQIVRLCS